jgi:hypothetical protein
MIEYKTYYFYSKNDTKKEAIDKVVTLNYEDALEHFTNRKQIDVSLFMSLYNIETYENRFK